MSNLHWQNKESKLIADCRVFSVYCNLAQAPGKEEIRDFYVLKLSNWATIIPVTVDRQVVLVKQYRHGTSQVTLEFPGGIVDLHEKDPRLTASRELFEETGYREKQLIHIGQHHPNPALQDNVCDVFLALNVEKISEPAFDTEGYEQIELCLKPLREVSELIASGDITHSAMITAFYYLELYEKKNPNIFVR